MTTNCNAVSYQRPRRAQVHVRSPNASSFTLDFYMLSYYLFFVKLYNNNNN